MDLVKMLTSVEFTEVRRGLDRDEVSAFLHEVAGAVAAMERRGAEAHARAERAEAKASELADDTSLRRTLVLAQRTADAAIAEAQDDARRIISEAEGRAADQLAEADAHAERTRTGADEAAALAVQSAQTRANQLLVEAKAEARRASEDLRAKLRQEVLDLENAREVLVRDVALFEAHMAEQRTRVQGALGALQMVLDHPDALRKMAFPTVTSVTVPAPAVIDNPVDAELAEAVSAAAGAVLDLNRTTSGSLMGSRRPTERTSDDRVHSSPGIRPSRPSRADDSELVIDLADITSAQPPSGVSRGRDDNTAEHAAVPSADDDELVKSFFEQSTFSDERWKPRKDRDSRRS